MGKRVLFLGLLCFLLFAEALSWWTAGGLGPCLVTPEHSQQAANDNEEHDCPTFFAGFLRLGERGFDWVKSSDNDKAVVAGFTIVLAISTIGLWLATIDLYRAGERQLELLTRTADISERALITTERAFVFIDGFDYELSLATDNKSGPDYENLPEWYKSFPELYITRFAIQPRWKNGGNTPTKNMTIRVNWRGPSGEMPPTKYVYRGEPAIPFFLGPQATQPGEVIVIPPALKLVDWEMNPVPPEPMILIWGRADYEDVFGRNHFVEWCYRLRFSRPGAATERMRATFIQWREYNRTDES